MMIKRFIIKTLSSSVRKYDIIDYNLLSYFKFAPSILVNRVYTFDKRLISFNLMSKLDIELLKQKLSKFNVEEHLATEVLKKTKYAERVLHVLTKTEVDSAEQSVSHLLLALAEKLDPAFYHRLDLFITYILSKKIHNTHQIDAGIEFIKTKGTDMEITKDEFETKCGVNVTITPEDIEKSIRKHLEPKKAQLEVERYKFNSMSILYDIKKDFAYLDNKLARNILLKVTEEILGGKNADELEEEKLRKEHDDLKAKKKKFDDSKKKKDSKPVDEFTADNAKRYEEVKALIKKYEDEYAAKLKAFKESQEQPKEEEENESDKLSKIIGRDMTSALNSDKLMQKHLEFSKGKVFTRFPPEPNGYIHIGHAKAMRFSFTNASKKGGHTYLRFDDTNPEKETDEFINSIKDNVKWLGYTPYKVTFASDYFEDLYNFAVELIKKGKAFVCHQSKEEISRDRELMKESPYRNRSVEENIALFEKMRQGRFAEKDACLRLKIDMKHPNTTMRDPVAYRIKYIPHPHVGNKWCIYPIYDFTHCISDSLENITHSLCTLEFEIRRDLYYWILEALDLYRPFVWEFSRLNISNNVISKRRLTALVDKKIIRGWDDPRLFTINGLRRRGFTPEAINHFVDSVGVTRRGNENIISIKVLEHSAKLDLDKRCPRTMAVLDPLEIVIVNYDQNTPSISVPLFPKSKELGTKNIHLDKKIYIERKDFQEKADKDFWGLAADQEVGLKYGGCLKVVKVKKNEKGEITGLECEYSAEEKKTKSRIHWISEKDTQRAEVRWYNLFFLKEIPGSDGDWLDDINPESEVIYRDALVNKNILPGLKHIDRFQFERLGFFCVDLDSDISKNNLVFNLTVKL